MLYVFHVDTGRMMTFDMNLALESVVNLKEMIERTCRVPASSQVLLVSGGEGLHSAARVCSYSAGTDTNPIYMFSTTVIESNSPPGPSIDYGSDVDLKDQVDASLQMPATYNTVVARAQLAQQFFELAKEQARICQKLVHDQHLQQQGWAAVVAHMEDITIEFRERSANLENSFSEHLERREKYLEFLSHFSDDIKTLAKIPILPALVLNASKKPFTAFDEIYADNESFTSLEKTNNGNIDLKNQVDLVNENSQDSSQEDQQKTKEALTLLHWISAKENKKSLEHIAEQCAKGLDLFDSQDMDTLRTDVKAALDGADQTGMKEIKGLGDRLYGLEQLMCETKRILQEQSDLAQSFQANQNRASNLGDASILPDLCASHQRQLKVMLVNHQHLRDIRRRCTKAKEELGVNLYHRLKWIVYIENRMFETDSRLMFYHRSLARLQRHLGIVEQIHRAPSMYVTAVNEVVRRRTFSQAFLVWASDIACHLLTIHNEEVMRRREFSSLFDGHFLNTLFPGMDDFPPAFATQAPSIFDSGLPKLNQNDVCDLQTLFPDLGIVISAPDLAAVLQFFIARSGNSQSQDKSGGDVDECLTKGLAEAGLGVDLQTAPVSLSHGDIGSSLSLLPHHQHLKDLERGFESETDTEEFENVGQSPIDRPTSQRHVGTWADRLHFMTDMSTLTEVRCSNQDKSSMSLYYSNADLSLTNTGPVSNVHYSKNISTLGPFPPKKPPRLVKSYNKSDSHSSYSSLIYSTTSTLPSIPEIGYSPSSDFKSVSNKTFSPESPDPIDLSPCPLHKVQGHHCHAESEGEFLTTEFYIDESMPTSLDSDNNEAISHSHDEHEELSEMQRKIDDVQTLIVLLQDNLGSTQIEADRIKSILKKMAELSNDCIKLLREQLSCVKVQQESACMGFKSECRKILENWEHFALEAGLREREMVQRLTVDHELEMSDVKKITSNKEEEIRSLIGEKIEMEKLHGANIAEVNNRKQVLLDEINGLKDKINNLENQLAEADDIKQKAVKDIQDKITREYKTEMESLRCRFRLMTFTNMERSPSDTSLEKIERADMIEIVNHEAILMQTKEDLLLEKESAIKFAVEQERSHWESKLNLELSQLKAKSVANQQLALNDVVQNIIDEKDKQIDALRERENNLTLECAKYQATIQKLMDNDNTERQTSTWPLMEQVETLQLDKCRLEAELSMERSKRLVPNLDMASSVAVVSPEPVVLRDVATSPEHTQGRGKQKQLTRSQTSLVQTGRINIASCSVGDPVLVVWDQTHGNYTILQETNTLYFLHSDSLNVLNLRPGSDGAPKKMYCTGEVEEKEYCHARKDENRYRVPKGTRFYRIKVRPLKSSREQHTALDSSAHGSKPGSPHSYKRASSSSSTNVCHSPSSRQTSVETQTISLELCETQHADIEINQTISEN